MSRPADGPGRFVRQVVLVVVAVGAGFLAAALFGGPAAASGAAPGNPGDERPQLFSIVVGTTAEVALDVAPAAHPHPAAGADERPEFPPVVPLDGIVGDLTLAPRRAQPAASRPPTTRPARRDPGEVPAEPVARTRTPVVAGVTGVTGQTEAGPDDHARADRREGAGGQRAAGRPQQPAPAGTTAPTMTAAGSSSVVGLVVAPLRHVVRIVSAGPVGAVVTALTRVTDAVLAPVLGAVTGPILAPPCGAPAPPPPPRAGAAPVGGPPDRPLPAAPGPPGEPGPGPTPGVAVPTVPTAPLPATEFGPVLPAGSVGSVAVRARLEPASSPGPGGPVPPADQAAAAVPHGAQFGSGLTAASGWLSRCSAGQALAAGTVFVQGRFPSVVARPG